MNPRRSEKIRQKFFLFFLFFASFPILRVVVAPASTKYNSGDGASSSRSKTAAAAAAAGGRSGSGATSDGGYDIVRPLCIDEHLRHLEKQVVSLN
jgi:hypothetical protein